MAFTDQGRRALPRTNAAARGRAWKRGEDRGAVSEGANLMALQTWEERAEGRIDECRIAWRPRWRTWIAWILAAAWWALMLRDAVGIVRGF